MSLNFAYLFFHLTYFSGSHKTLERDSNHNRRNLARSSERKLCNIVKLVSGLRKEAIMANTMNQDKNHQKPQDNQTRGQHPNDTSAKRERNPDGTFKDENNQKQPKS